METLAHLLVGLFNLAPPLGAERFQAHWEKAWNAVRPDLETCMKLTSNHEPDQTYEIWLKVSSTGEILKAARGNFTPAFRPHHERNAYEFR